MASKKWFNTYGSNPMSCAAGRAVLRAIDEDRTMENARKVGDYMKEKLLALKDKYDLIGDVRGSGLMLGVELVTDRSAKIPADEETGRIAEFAKDNGVIIGKGGAMGNILRINPPLCIRKEDMDVTLDVLEQALRQI
jgi:alanine-glyoxylate transaminase/(R)-3-amino-2-methylpropionate-pyruvate transaminase